MNNLKPIMKQKVMGVGMPKAAMMPSANAMPAMPADPTVKKPFTPFKKKPGFGQVATNPSGPASPNLFKRLTGK